MQLKTLLKPVYNLTHDLLFDQMALHPFFPKTINGKKIRLGFVSDEHLNNPSLDEQLLANLGKEGISTGRYTIDVGAYYKYIAETVYPESYYGGGLDPANNFTEKTLEHFVSFSFLNLQAGQLLIDVAAATSPFCEISLRRFNLMKAYQQDLIYTPGVNDNRIGGFAHEIPLKAESVDAVSLHCSLEHFENDSDTRFFQTLERILKPGGRCVVLPFYIANTYTIHLDPAFNLLKSHHPVIDPLAEVRYCKWKQYHSRHYDPPALQRRILKHCPLLKLSVYKIENFREISPNCYLRFVGVFEKLG